MSASPIHFSRAHRTLVPIAFTGLAGVATLAHPSATRLQTWPWALAAAALWIFPCAWLATGLATQTRWHVPGALLSASLALLAVGALVAACISPFGTLSVVQVWPTLGSVALCFALHDWIQENDSRQARTNHVARGISVVAAVIAVSSAAAWLFTGAPNPWAIRNTFPFGHSTYTAGFVVLALPWLVERTWSSRGRLRVLWCGGVLASIAALMGTSSRAGVLVLAFGCAIATLVVLLRSRWPRRQKLLLAASAVAIAAAAFVTNPRLRELAQRRGWGDAARASNRERSAMLDAGVRLGRERPWFGWGPGAVPLAYPHVRARLEGGDENVLQLHNTPVQLFATLGGLGLASGGLLLIAIGASIVRGLRQRTLSSVEIAAATSLAGTLAFSLTDHQLDLPIFAAITAASVALVARHHSRPIVLTVRARTLLAGGMTALAIGPAVALGRDLLARQAFDRALAAMEKADTPAVLRSLDRATSLLPGDPFFQHHAAAWLLRESEKGPSAHRRELTDAAIGRLEASLRTGIHLEPAHFNLGWLLLDRGRGAEAAAHFLEAARLVPDKGGVYFGLGLACLALHRTNDAIRAFALEWLNDPRQFTSPSWEVPTLAAMTPAVRADLVRLVDTVVRRDPSTAPFAAWIRWWQGETIAPRELAAGFSTESAAFAQQLAATGETAGLAARFTSLALHAAWHECSGFDSPAIAGGDGALAAALASRARGHRGDFREFITAPIGDSAALAIAYRRQRSGYGVLASHPEGPFFTDVYIVQESRVAQLAAPLFPPKGWLPGRFLLALLPDLSLSNGPPNPR